jgi:predicted nucleic-acid-binding protein
MKFLIDTNIFLRLIAKDNKRFYNDCVRLIEQIRNGLLRAFTANLIIAEIEWTLRSFYKLSKEDTNKAIQGILNVKNFEIRTEPDVYLAIDIFEKNNVKFIDALIASIPEINNKKSAIISFDTDFDKLDILRFEPRDVKPQMI